MDRRMSFRLSIVIAGIIRAKGECGSCGVCFPGPAFAAEASRGYASGSFLTGPASSVARDLALDNHTGGGNMTSATLFFAAITLTAATADRWESDIAAYEAMDRKSPPVQDGIVFIGSSSVRLWDVRKSFPDLPVVNRGFGGSQLADSVRYADRILIPYRPKTVVLYAGDNDLAAGKSPEQVLADYKAFAAKVHGALPDTRIVYVAVKPSPKRWALIEKIRETNRLIRAAAEQDPRQVFVDVEKPMLTAEGQPRAELYRPDELHLNDEGYKLWTELVRPHLEKKE